METEVIKKVCHDKETIKNLGKLLNEKRKEAKYCDFVLKTADGGNFSVHKIILEAVSPFFDKKFNNPNFGASNDEFLLIDDITSNVLGKIIEFMYTSEVEITSDIAKEALDTALFLDLKPLIKTCTEILIETVNIRNCFELLDYSETFSGMGGDSLTKKCIEIIFLNLKTYADTPEFLAISSDSVKVLVQHEHDKTMVEQLFSAIVKWITFDLEKRQKFICPLMDHINFEIMSYEFRFTKVLQDNPLLENHNFLLKIKDVLKAKWQNERTKKIDFDFNAPHAFTNPPTFGTATKVTNNISSSANPTGINKIGHSPQFTANTVNFSINPSISPAADRLGNTRTVNNNGNSPQIPNPTIPGTISGSSSSQTSNVGAFGSSSFAFR